MIGGLFKSTSRFALIAAAGVIAGSVGAQAADLGGNCCADLEERVAELEATTARKGNRRVSLTVSGQVNEAVMFWDDGEEQNVYVVSNNDSRTRFRFVGDAKITADWSAGYLLEIGVRYANSGNRNQTTQRAGGDLNALDIRHSAWWLDSKTFGRLWVGETSSATDGITEINLANSIVGSDPSSWNGGFFLRRPGGAPGQAGLSAVTWNNITPSFVGAWNAGEGDRNNIVRYVSPTFAGFIFSAAWGEDDMWDVALRYAGEFGGFRLAAGVGYRQQSDSVGKSGADGAICADLSGDLGPGLTNSNVDCNNIGVSASVMHVATGLYVSGSWGLIQDENRQALYGRAVEDEDEHWYVQAGIEQKFFALGKTTIYGEYGDYTTGAGLSGTGAIGAYGTLGGQAQLDSSDVTVWGFGLVQNIEAAAMDLYINFRHFEADLTTSNAAGTILQNVNPQDFQAVKAGAIIRF